MQRRKSATSSSERRSAASAAAAGSSARRTWVRSWRKWASKPWLTFHDRTSASKKFQCDESSTVVPTRSEEHTSELQSLMRISYAVFCLKKKKANTRTQLQNHNPIKPLEHRHLLTSNKKEQHYEYNT